MKYLLKHRVVTLCTALSLILGFLFLGKESYWVDEISSITFTRDFTTMLDIMLHKETNMWLYYIMLHFWSMVSESEVWVRSLSVIFAVLSVPALYVVTKELFQERTAKIATLLFVLNTFVLFYAQEARSYSLFLFMSLLSTLFWVKLIKHNKPKDRLLWVITSALMVYSQLIGVLYFGMQVLLYLLFPGVKANKALFKYLAFFGLLLLPIILYPAELISGILNWIPRPSLQDLNNLFLTFSSESAVLIGIYFGGILFAAQYCLAEYKRNGFTKNVWMYLAMFVLAFLPAIIVFVESIVYKPRFIDRYFITSLPPFLILALFVYEPLIDAFLG